MNEVMQIRAASWAAMIKQRNDSGLTIREWCAANGIQESVYLLTLQKSYTKGLLTLLTHRETSEAPAYFYRSCGRHP